MYQVSCPDTKATLYLKNEHSTGVILTWQYYKSCNAYYYNLRGSGDTRQFLVRSRLARLSNLLSLIAVNLSSCEFVVALIDTQQFILS